MIRFVLPMFLICLVGYLVLYVPNGIMGPYRREALKWLMVGVVTFFILLLLGLSSFSI
jgi:hypothetical protein